MAPILSEEETAIDPYELLGIKVEATESEIKSTYRKLSLKCHPDRVSPLCIHGHPVANVYQLC
jgi:DnaJ family protein C protein 17